MKLLLAESHYQPEHLKPFALIVGTPPIGFKVGYPLRIQAKRGWHTSSPQALTSTVRGRSWLAVYNPRQTGQIPSCQTSTEAAASAASNSRRAAFCRRTATTHNAYTT